MIPKYIRNTGQAWTTIDNRILRELASKNTPTRVIGLLMGRTEDAIRTRAAQSKVSLKPTNQRPYGTR